MRARFRLAWPSLPILLLCAGMLHASDVGTPSTLTSIRELLDAHRAQGQVLLRGTVTYTGRETIVQDQTGAIAVNSSAPVSLALGDQVEVQGDLYLRNDIPRVENATIRNLWTGSTPLPLAIAPDEAAEGAYNGMLVAIEGQLVRASDASRGPLRLTLVSGDQLFTCVMGSYNSVSLSLTPGETLRCTGVLSVNPADHAFESGTFLVLLRNGRDLHLLSPAPWWNTRHLLLCFIVLLLLILLGYRLHLRSLRMRMSLVVEERSRIAREIHDTLAQGFAGIALQLQAIHRTMGQQSPAVHDHLSMALQMVRRSRAEAHRSIATLRALHSSEHLIVIFDKLLRQLTAPAGIALHVAEKGTPFTLNDELCSQILRISQEAVANTLEHAGASTIHATVHYSARSVLVELQDDGCGFNTHTAATADQGHFGIAGMHERAAQIRASFSIDSSPRGTRLSLQIPVTPPGPLPIARWGWPNQAMKRILLRRGVHP